MHSILFHYFLQAGWNSSSVPEGILVFAENTNLYLSTKLVQVRVNSRKCLDRICTIAWDGADQYIFRLSKDTCAGYEIGKFLKVHVKVY